MNTISSIIPVYQDSGLPFEILKEAVNSLLIQTHPPVEIILSDDSSGMLVENWVEEFNLSNSRSLIYVRNLGPSGVSSNSNFAAKLATGTYVHFLHSDDHLIGKEVYSKVIKTLESTSHQWLLLGGQMRGIVTIPNLENLNLFGVNSVGGPSGLVIKRSIFEGFDENISLLMDIEFFLRTAKNYGSPLVLRETCIEYGSGDWQLTKSINEVKYRVEIDHLWKNGQLGFNDFLKLLALPDSWDIKRGAYSYIRSNSGLGGVKRVLALVLFRFKYSRFRIMLFKKSLSRVIFSWR
jgi:glycosyltransferase involved in cell wall biosynthesis